MNARIRLKETMYLIPSNPTKTIKILHPQIKIDKQWCYIKDDTTQTKLAEAKDEIDAYRIALRALSTVGGRE